MEGKDVHENNQQLFQKMMSKLSQGRKIKKEKKTEINEIQNETPSTAAPPPIINKSNTPVKFTKNTLLNNKRKTPPTEHEEFPKLNKRKKHVSR
jgi:hypothetical protein